MKYRLVIPVVIDLKDDIDVPFDDFVNICCCLHNSICDDYNVESVNFDLNRLKVYDVFKTSFKGDTNRIYYSNSQEVGFDLNFLKSKGDVKHV